MCVNENTLNIQKRRKKNNNKWKNHIQRCVGIASGEVCMWVVQCIWAMYVCVCVRVLFAYYGVLVCIYHVVCER